MGRMWWGVAVVLVTAVAVLWAPTRNSFELIRARREVVRAMTEVVEQHGEVARVEAEPWTRTASGDRCEAQVSLTVVLDGDARQVEELLRRRLGATVFGVGLSTGPDEAVATALLVRPRERVLFGCG